MPAAAMTSVGLHARQREEAAQKDRERMAAPKERHTLRSLLDEAGLPHLEAVIDGGGASLTDLQARLSSNRPMLLTYLRDLGIERLGERQQLANALTKAEKAGRLPPPNPMPHLRPATFEEHDDGTVSVWLQLPANTASSQLKLSLDANSLHVTLAGAPTALAGRLYGLVKPKDCTWQIERAQRAEYDPLVGAAEQPTTPDTMAITLVKAEPRAWTALFVDGAFARRYIPPPPAPKVPERKEPLKLNKNPGISPLAFKPRKFDPGARAQREAQQAYTAKHGALEAEAAARSTASAKEFWPSATAVLVWREGCGSVRGAPEHPEDTEPLYWWVEDPGKMVVRAPTRRGLAPSELKLRSTASSVECFVGGCATPWCGHLVGKIVPDKCTLEVISGWSPPPPCRGTVAESGGEVGGAGTGAGESEGGAALASCCDTLQLTLIKAESNLLWLAPWPELKPPLDLRDKKAAMHGELPRRDQLQIDGWEQVQEDGKWVIRLPFKAGKYLTNDQLRVAVTRDGLNVHIAGQEDSPFLAGKLRGRIEPSRCTWRVRHCKPKGTTAVDEMVITIAKEQPSSSWRDLFQMSYV